MSEFLLETKIIVMFDEGLLNRFMRESSYCF